MNDLEVFYSKQNEFLTIINQEKKTFLENINSDQKNNFKGFTLKRNKDCLVDFLENTNMISLAKEYEIIIDQGKDKGEQYDSDMKKKREKIRKSIYNYECALHYDISIISFIYTH